MHATKSEKLGKGLLRKRTNYHEAKKVVDWRLPYASKRLNFWNFSSKLKSRFAIYHRSSGGLEVVDTKQVQVDCRKQAAAADKTVVSRERESSSRGRFIIAEQRRKGRRNGFSEHQ